MNIIGSWHELSPYSALVMIWHSCTEI